MQEILKKLVRIRVCEYTTSPNMATKAVCVVSNPAIISILQYTKVPGE
jgi:hypothetical protein